MAIQNAPESGFLFFFFPRILLRIDFHSLPSANYLRVPYGYSYGPSHTSKRSGLRKYSYLSLISSSQVYSMDLPFPRAVSGCISFFMYLRVLAYL